MDAPASRLLRTSTLASLVLASLSTGCGGEKAAPVAPLHAVTGKVTLPRSGPVPALKIEFIPDGPGARTASGEVKPDGSFGLTTDAPGDGIAEGNYKVRVEPMPGTRAKGSPPVVASQFMDEDASGLTAVVTASTTEVGPFVLKPTPAVARGVARSND